MQNVAILFLVLALMVGALASNARSESATTLVEWDFDLPEDAAAWSPRVAVKGLAVQEGCLAGRTVGRDPSVASPPFEIQASPYQYVEIRMRTTRSGYGELFWTNTTEEPYVGFRPNLHARIDYTAGDFRTYRIFPFWQNLGKIIRIRLDPPENAEFAVDYIRIVEITASPSNRAFFDFTQPEQLWMSADDPQPTATPKGIVASGPGERYFVSPRLDIDSESFPWLTVMIRSDGADHAVLQWVSDELPRVGSYTILLKPDGDWHVYNIRTDELPEWLGRVQMLAMKVNLAEGQRAEVKFAGASTSPMGPAEFDVKRFGLREVVNRTGKPAVLQAQLMNVGGEPARGIRAALNANAGTAISGRSVHLLDELQPGEGELLTWHVQSGTPGACDAFLEVASSSARLAAGTKLRWDPPVSAKRSAYVPEPRPVRGEFEVGMYYFPGWHTYSRWSVLDDFPERRPVLGYYREGDPEVVDWHIKWMLEHGVTFIVYDWYWSAGARQLEHALHQGFFNAKYRGEIKFCLLWANHNAPKTSSAEDMVNVTSYWLDNYFLLPEYFKIDGKPVVVIFSPRRLTDDMGSEGVRQAFEKSREMAKARGLAGIYFAACTWPSPGRLEIMEREGYDALTGYNYPSAGDKGQVVAPYDDMVTGYREIWNTIADGASLRYIPVTEPGWDSRPWHGPNARVRTGKTPEKFKKMLQNAKQFVARRNPDAKPKIVLIEAWNEFGEGDYVEPHREFGFGHVDAIREVLTSAPKEHDDIVPQDVGLGPYELSQPEPLTAWEFDDPTSPGWDASQNLRDGKVGNGRFTALSSGPDPALYSESVDLDSAKFGAVEIRMKVDKGTVGQLFWAGRARGFTEAASTRFDLAADGEFHTYKLELSASPAWKSRVTALRLDPTDAARARIAVDYIRFVAGT